jgi:hypothetical protein
MKHMSTPLTAHNALNGLLVITALCLGTAAIAQTPSFAPAPAVNTLVIDPLARTTPVSVAQNYSAYQAQRDAMKALIDSGKANINGYDLSKSKCWLEVSFHEYTRNDRSPFAQDALTESQRITQHLAGTAIAPAPNAVNGSLGIATASPASQTLLVNGGQRLRSDLWSKADAYKWPAPKCNLPTRAMKSTNKAGATPAPTSSWQKMA